MTHELKTWPQYFTRVKLGLKTFEVRKNDRGFQMGDEVWLREWRPDVDPDEKNPYTGRDLKFKIGYVYQLPDNMCVFSLLAHEARPQDGAETKGEG